MSLRVVDVEGDEVLSLDAGTALVIDPDIFSFKTQLEELTLGDGDLHLSVLTVHLCLNDGIITCWTEMDVNSEYVLVHASGINVCGSAQTNNNKTT